MKKELFKFTTEKPSAFAIWKTLDAVDIEPSEGYTGSQIRFIYYCIFQLHTDFKMAKAYINKSTGTITSLDNLAKKLLKVSVDFTALIYPPANLPSWVVPELYTPYYLFKQLQLPVTSDLWVKLFDRTIEEHTKAEADSIIADLVPIEESITAYKLWREGDYSILHHKFSDIYAITSTSDCVEITDKSEIYDYMEHSISQYLADNPIYDYSQKILLPQFKLKAPDASQ